MSDIPATIDEAIDSLHTSSDVKLRTRSVIASWLHERYGTERQVGMRLAGELIKAMTDAGLSTFIDADLRTFIKLHREKTRA